MKSKPARKYRYDFWFDGRRWVSPGYPTIKERDDAEVAKRKELCAIRDGRELDQSNSPFIADFAEIYYDWALRKKKVASHSAFWGAEMALRFFGRKPVKPRPINTRDRRGFKNKWLYLDLKMSEVLRDGEWITKFENWMDERGVSGGTKNKYRTGMSQIFQHAMSPEWRNKTGVTRNPFAGGWRDEEGAERRQTFDTTAALVKVIAEAKPHLKLAIAIALYCPKFRHGSICRLDTVKQPDSTAWVDEGITQLWDAHHKTVRKKKQPLVATIEAPLRRLILSAVKQQERRHARLLTRYKRDGNLARLKQLGQTPCTRLIQWEGRPVASLKTGFKSACKRAGVPYGIKNGVTFHSLKHEGGTAVAGLPGISDPELQQMLGHDTNAANQIYRHRVPAHERRVAMALSKTVQQRLKTGAKDAKLFAQVG